MPDTKDDGSSCLLSKKIISSDFQEVGLVVSTDHKRFIISRGSDNNEYRIPKLLVHRLHSSDVLVDFRLNDLLLVELATLSFVV